MMKTYHQKQHKLLETSVCGGNQGKNRASAGAGGCWEASHRRRPASKEGRMLGIYTGGGEGDFSLQGGL